MASEVLLVERRGPVGWLIFNRPERGNAMDAEMLAELPRAWARLADEREVASIVVTGAGSKFQTGLDVGQLATEPGALREIARQTRRAEPRLTGRHLGVTKPIITAVNGLCVGGGLHFVADSDIVIASSTASFLDSHVSVGQVSAFETIGLARRAAFGPVARMALVGAHERIDAERARRLGWVSEVVVPEDLRSTAQHLAELVAANDPRALAATKRMLWQSLDSGLRDTRRAADER
jgi:enoyl-CoA hydratase/carnithine racemase